MAVRRPSHLRAPRYHVCEDVGCGPGVVLGVDEAGDFGIGSVADAEPGRYEGADKGTEIVVVRGGRTGRSRDVGRRGGIARGGDVIAELVGEAFCRVGGVGQDGGEPVVFWIRCVEFCLVKLLACCIPYGFSSENVKHGLRRAVAKPPVSWSLVPTSTPLTLSRSRKSSTLLNALSYASTSCTCATGSFP